MTTQSNSTFSLRGWTIRRCGHGLAAVCGVVIGLSALSVPVAQGQTFPPGFTATTLVSTDLPRPIRLCLHTDGRLFIAQQGGTVRIWKENEGLLPTPYYTFPTSYSGENGLLGIALNPDPTSEFTLFAYYNNSNLAPNGSSRVVRIRAANPADDVAIPNSETLLISPSTFSGIHNGGGLQFGIDGKLYISVGEGGTQSNAQSLANLRGKVLRINADGSIPDDNPTSFHGIVGTTTGVNRAIYAVGFRNPFHLSVQPVSGRLFINDVDPTQQVNEGFAGRNYGWGSTAGPVTQPLVEYPYGSGPNAGHAIVGGEFYNPPVCALPPQYYNSYFFAEYFSDWIKFINLDTLAVTSFATAIGGVTDMEFDPQGRMYLVSNDGNRLIRLEYTAPLPPTLAREPKSFRLCAGETARFSIVPSGNVPLTYQWRHDNVDLVDNARISGSTGLELTINDVQATDVGVYKCFIANALGNVLSAPPELGIGMTAGSRTGTEIARFITLLQSGTGNATDLCHFDFDGDAVIDMDDVPGLIDRLLE